MNVLFLSITSADGPVIRGMTASDGAEQWSVYDFINLVCGKNLKDSYGRVLFSRFINESSEYSQEVVTLCNNLKFPGSGQRDTPTMTI